MKNHIRLTTEDGFGLILPKSNVAVSTAPNGHNNHGKCYVFLSTNQNEGWIVIEHIDWILARLDS